MTGAPQTGCILDGTACEHILGWVSLPPSTKPQSARHHQYHRSSRPSSVVRVPHMAGVWALTAHLPEPPALRPWLCTRPSICRGWYRGSVWMSVASYIPSLPSPKCALYWNGRAPLVAGWAIFWAGPCAWDASHSPGRHPCMAQRRLIRRSDTPTPLAGRCTSGLPALLEDMPYHVLAHPCHRGGSFVWSGGTGELLALRNISGAAYAWADAQNHTITYVQYHLRKRRVEPLGFTEYREWFIMFIYISPTQHDKWKEKQFMLSCCPLQWSQEE